MNKPLTVALNTATFKSIEPEALANYADWWAIYESCFPSSEREPADVILLSLRTGKGMAFGAFYDEKLIGISTIHLLEKPAAVFLVYLSLKNEFRANGIGTNFLNYIFEEGQLALRERGYEPVGNIWEVERPSEAASESDRISREKRIRFFEKNNARCLSINYKQPPVDGKTYVPMHLMLHNKPSLVEDTDLHIALAKAIYFEKYGSVNNISEDILNNLFQAI